MTPEFKRTIFLNRRFEANSFQVGKVRLNSTIYDLDLTKIVDIYVDHKGYENLNFSTRLELLKNNSGWVHYAAGASFGVENGTISQIKLSTKYLQDNNTTKHELLSIFGQPDIELVDDICYSALDYHIDAYILVYRQKQIYAFVDPETEILKELHFGKLDETIYTQRGNPADKTSLRNANRSWWRKLFGC